MQDIIKYIEKSNIPIQKFAEMTFGEYILWNKNLESLKVIVKKKEKK